MLYNIPQHILERVTCNLNSRNSYLFFLTSLESISVDGNLYYHLTKKYGPTILFKYDMIDLFEDSPYSRIFPGLILKLNRDPKANIVKWIVKYGSTKILKWLIKNDKISPDVIFNSPNKIQRIIDRQKEFLMPEPSITHCHVSTDYIYLSPDERQKFAKVGVEYLIDPHSKHYQKLKKKIGGPKKDPLMFYKQHEQYEGFWIYFLEKYGSELKLSEWSKGLKSLLEFFMKSMLVGPLIKIDELADSEYSINGWSGTKSHQICRFEADLKIPLLDLLNLNPEERDQIIQIYFNKVSTWKNIIEVSSKATLDQINVEQIIYLTSLEFLADQVKVKEDLYTIGILSSLESYQFNDLQMIYEHLIDHDLMDKTKIDSLIKIVLKTKKEPFTLIDRNRIEEMLEGAIKETNEEITPK